MSKIRPTLLVIVTAKRQCYSSIPFSTLITMLQITNSLKLVLTGLTFLMAFLCVPSQGSAQDVEKYLRKADLNDDGKIEPSETTMHLRRYLIGKGFDTREGHQIADILKKTSASKPKPKAKSDLKVPKFGVDPKTKSGVGAFGATAGESVEYSESVTRRTQSTFDRYDVDSNGFLEGSEIANVRWGSLAPSVSDKNGDGRLSFQELQERFRVRETALQRSGQSSSDSGLGRGRDSDGRNSVSGQRGGRRGRFNRPGDNRSRFNRGYSQNSRDDDDEDEDEDEDENDRSTRNSSRSASFSRSSREDERQKREKAEKYVKGYFEKHDLDKNGVIEGEELTKVTSKARYDKDRNGKITKAEVYAIAAPSSDRKNVTTSSRNRSSRNRSSSSNNSRRNSQLPSSFVKVDVNKDRLVQMHEFSDTWTKDKLEEFRMMDSNGDGAISPDEW